MHSADLALGCTACAWCGWALYELLGLDADTSPVNDIGSKHWFRSEDLVKAVVVADLDELRCWVLGYLYSGVTFCVNYVLRSSFYSSRSF